MASKIAWLLQNTEDPNLFGLGTMDIVYDSGGRLATVQDAEKLQFLLVKCVLTSRYVEGTQSYGSTIPRLLGQRVRGANELVDGLYVLAVDSALESFRKAQPTDLDPSETMSRVDGEIGVSRDRSDRTIVLVGASVKNGQGTEIPVVHSFKSY
jgi:hypothetical protein